MIAMELLTTTILTNGRDFDQIGDPLKGSIES